MTILGINKINKIYDSILQHSDNQAAEGVLKQLDITYTINPSQQQNIPVSGGVIVISNHPSGALDGVILLDLLIKIRPDVKFLGNYLLSRIEPLKDFFIDVDPFNTKNAKNIHGIRQAMEHTASGGMLVIFPAGEVSTYQKGFTGLMDKEWPESIIKFIRKANVPVLPVYIENSNSRLFHFTGMIHPMIRTAMLPHELINKRGRNINIAVGTPLSQSKLADIKTIADYSKFLRTNVYLLKESIYREDDEDALEITETAEDLIAPVELDKLLVEIEVLKQEHLLFSHSNYMIFCAPSSLMPNFMTEIARLREITYRQIGEGTNTSSDSDKYDSYYHQLFIWDNENWKVIGAYRVGYGEEIVRDHGLEGFYTNSLFRMKDAMIPLMSATIELGRSFIIKEHQKKPVTLMLLWKGILYVLLKNEHYRYLLGPVSISGEMREVSKLLIVDYIKKHHFDYELAKNIKPVTGLDGLTKQIDPGYIDSIQDIDALDKLVSDIEHYRFSVPVLIKRYIQLGGRVIGFNVDHEFNDTLDALLILDLAHIPQQTIAMLSKELNIDVMSRFRSN